MLAAVCPSFTATDALSAATVGAVLTKAVAWLPMMNVSAADDDVWPDDFQVEV